MKNTFRTLLTVGLLITGLSASAAEQNQKWDPSASVIPTYQREKSLYDQAKDIAQEILDSFEVIDHYKLKLVDGNSAFGEKKVMLVSECGSKDPLVSTSDLLKYTYDVSVGSTSVKNTDDVRKELSKFLEPFRPNAFWESSCYVSHKLKTELESPDRKYKISIMSVASGKVLSVEEAANNKTNNFRLLAHVGYMPNRIGFYMGKPLPDENYERSVVEGKKPLYSHYNNGTEIGDFVQFRRQVIVPRLLDQIEANFGGKFVKPEAPIAEKTNTNVEQPVTATEETKTENSNEGFSFAKIFSNLW